MAAPVIVGANVVSRVGPWLSRMGPKAWESASRALTSVGVAVRNPSELVNYMRSNKIASASVLSTLATAGFAVSDLFSPEDKANPEQRELAADLAAKEVGKIMSRIEDVAASSEALSGLTGDPSNLRLLRDVCRFAIAHYGSVSSAKNAFLMHQAFFELSQEDLETGMELLA